jgi:hypothetical protein
MQLSNEAGQSQVMGDIDIKGKDWNGQVKLGTPQFLGERRSQTFDTLSNRGSRCIQHVWLGTARQAMMRLQHAACC